jgi:F-type H+-transporting ATPase subunit a
MEHGSTWIAEWVNGTFGPLVAALLGSIYALAGSEYVAGDMIIPEHVTFAVLVFLFFALFFPIMHRSFSVEKPGKVQQILELVVEFLNSQMEEVIGPGGKKYLPMVATIGTFILVMNLCGQIPGFASPTTSINVTIGCALVVVIYYHYLGVRQQGLIAYLKHFAGPVPWLAPLMVPIEIISHLARPFSLSVRLFANIFGEHQVAAVFFALIPFIVPIPILALGLFTSVLQAFIFMVLTMVYIAGAVSEEH